MEGGSLERGPEGQPLDDGKEGVRPAAPRSFSPRARRAPPGAPLKPPPNTEALREVIDNLPEQIALVDNSWTIVAANKAWADSVAAGDRAPLPEGSNYLDFCAARAGEGEREAMIVLEALNQISSGRRRTFRHVYAKPGPNGPREYKINISSFESGGARFATITRYEVTKLMALTRERRRLEKSLVRSQEEERRRIGRELHDATAQLLVAFQLCMIRLKSMHDDGESRAVFAEIDETLGKVNEEIRAISYLLHPPSLDDAGLVESLDAMARGFARRTNLQISFWFDGRQADWDPMIETTLYRLAQEALANVHRHAHADQVGIRLVARPSRFLHLIIEDDGIGIPEAPGGISAPLGVGVAGMRSRVAELGGRFAIRRVKIGTCIIASIPLTPRRPRPLDFAP